MGASAQSLFFSLKPQEIKSKPTQLNKQRHKTQPPNNTNTTYVFFLDKSFTRVMITRVMFTARIHE